MTSSGYTEDVRLSNIRLLLGIIIIAIALVAQFYPKKFPHNKDFLIGCILLVVNEIHSSATKNNKEWQDKLPFVVLKAEEIMYSKANSEAEYMDLETLPDRDSDAINTIIRRDEASESGDFLPPLY